MYLINFLSEESCHQDKMLEIPHVPRKNQIKSFFLQMEKFKIKLRTKAVRI